MSLRNERVRKTLMKEIADIIQKDIRDPRIEGVISITDIELAHDNSFAKVYFSVFSTNDDAKKKTKQPKENDSKRKRKQTKNKSNNSKAISIEVIGQFVTAQKKAIIPQAAHNLGSKPNNCPIVHPKVAPMQKDGTISPPLNPAFIVRAVKINFHKKSQVLTFPNCTAFTINSVPAPI